MISWKYYFNKTEIGNENIWIAKIFFVDKFPSVVILLQIFW